MSSRHNFSGIWRSTFWYPSNHHEGFDSADYVVTVHQRGDKLTAESLPRSTKAHMTINLVITDMLATGTWVEDTAPESEWDGMEYSGAMQLIIAEDGKSMDGQWVGIGREHLPDGTFEPRIYNGRWQMAYMKDAAIPTADEDANDSK